MVFTQFLRFHFSLGNLAMITREGGLHKFLQQHHKKFGPIFSFYWGKELVVSLGSPQLFKDVQTLFDRPSKNMTFVLVLLKLNYNILRLFNAISNGVFEDI